MRTNSPCIRKRRAAYESGSIRQRRLGHSPAPTLLDNGHDVTLWSHSPEKAERLSKTRENPLLKGVPLPEPLHITGDLSCLEGAALVVSAPPSFAVRETGHQAAPYLGPDTVLVSVSKGIERDTNLRLSGEAPGTPAGASWPCPAPPTRRRWASGCPPAASPPAGTAPHPGLSRTLL